MSEKLTPGYRISIPLTHVDGPEERELLRRRHPPHPDIPRNLIAQGWFESGYDTAALEFWDVVHEANRELAARDAEIERLEEERDRLRRANETLAVRMDLTASQLLMVGSELCGDGKIDPTDHRDPRWTPTLQRAAEVMRELAALARPATNREEPPTP